MPTGVYKRKPFTEEHLKNMSNSRKGNKHHFFGKKLSKEHVEKNRLGHLGQKAWHKDRKGVYTKEALLKMSKAKKGHIPSEETKEKMRKANGNPSPELRRKISDLLKGDKAPNWKGGIATENHKIRDGIEMRLAREACFARDNWTCQKYFIKGGKINAHHINNFSDFPELRFAIDNLITLSNKAHREFHSIYGYRNNTREQLLEFLKELMYENK